MSLISEQGAGRVSNLRVTNANSRRIRIAWTGVTGATGYRITWRQGNSKCYVLKGICELIILKAALSYCVSLHMMKPTEKQVTDSEADFDASYLLWHILYLFLLCITGAEQSRLVAADILAYTIDGLQPDQVLVIGVAAMADERVGEVVTVTSRTNPHSGSVSGLRIVDVTSRTIRITWSSSPRATGYKITWRRDDGKQ